MALLLAYRGTVRIAAATFYDLRGCVFKILVYVNQNSVSLHQAKQSDTYINSWKAKRLCGCWEEQKDTSISLCDTIETSGTFCSSFDVSEGCRILAGARMDLHAVFQGKNRERVRVLDRYAAVLSVQLEGFAPQERRGGLFERAGIVWGEGARFSV